MFSALCVLVENVALLFPSCQVNNITHGSKYSSNSVLDHCLDAKQIKLFGAQEKIKCNTALIFDNLIVGINLKGVFV